MAGEGTPPTIESSENRAGADMAAGGGLPADGQDRGATADVGGMSMSSICSTSFLRYLILCLGGGKLRLAWASLGRGIQKVRKK